LKNNNYLRTLYKSIPKYNVLCADCKHHWMDEKAFTYLLKDIGNKKIRIYWDRYLVNNKNGRAHQEYYLDRWKWENGKLYELYGNKKIEHMYLHFINWKSTMGYCEVNNLNYPQKFYISYNGIHY